MLFTIAPALPVEGFGDFLTFFLGCRSVPPINTIFVSDFYCNTGPQCI